MAKNSFGKPHKSATAGQPAGLPARALAAEALRRVLAERRSIEDALHLARKPGVTMPEADFALARAIVTVTFRRLGTIRAAIAARLTGQDLPDIGPLVQAVTIGAAQLLFMDVPDHAAVDLSVEIAKGDAKARHYASLANALLRRIAREKSTILESASPQLDTPEWLAARWTRAYGETAAGAIAAIHGTPPHIDLTPMQETAELHALVGGTRLPNGSIRLDRADAISTLPGYAEGLFQVQDVAASLPARLLGAEPGMRIADLCAAPGGKTAQIASAGARVIAVERSAERAKRLHENLSRLRLDAEIAIGDAMTFNAPPFDAVLLDAPCSATGTIRRHPEVAWTKTLADILALARQQAKMLNHAAGLVKPGGVLVYATCSLEPEEGERQIEVFLAANPHFSLAAYDGEAMGIPASAIPKPGILRVLPSDFASFGGADGFFAARLQRRP